MVGKKFALSLLVALSLPAYAQYFGKGEYAVINSEKNACHLAELRAINDAAFKAFGKTITTREHKKCSNCNIDIDTTITTSSIVDKVLSKTTKVDNNICYVDISVSLKPSRYLDVTVKGKDIHKAGTPIHYDVATKDPVYMYVFATASEKLDILFPLDYNNYTVKGSFKFPFDDMKITPILDEGELGASNDMLFLFSTIPLDFDRDNISIIGIQEIVDALPLETRRLIRRETLIVN